MKLQSSVASADSPMFITKENWDYYFRHCRGKVKHETAQSAQSHVDSLHRKLPADDFHYYRCDFCKKLHVGHIKFVSMK